MSTVSEDLATQAVEIAPDTFWVGKRDPERIFYSNPYLRRFRGKGQGEAPYNLLIDPGSATDFAVIRRKVGDVAGDLGHISSAFLNHQDPDVGSSLAMIIAGHAPEAAIICSNDTWRLVVHQGLPLGRHISTAGFTSAGMTLPTGDRVRFVPTPFCHFSGAVALYDPETRVLFSGDLLGGLTDIRAEGLWADESDWKGIAAFHQLYMPTREALTRAVETIRRLDPPVSIIAPQHGRLIQGAWVELFLARLARLPVGLDLTRDESDGQDLQSWTLVVNRVIAAAHDSGISVDMVLGAAAREFADAVTFDQEGAHIHRQGRFTAGLVVRVLVRGTMPEVKGRLQQEALVSSSAHGLPTPELELEDLPPTA